MISAKPANVDEYINSFPKQTQKALKQIRKIIKKEASAAQETISYGMPTYKLNGILVYFAGFKNHIGLYALPSGNKAFKKEISNYKTGKGSIQFPLDKPMPLDLISDIVKFRAQENLQKQKKKS